MYIEELIHRLSCTGAFAFHNRLHIDKSDIATIDSLGEQSQFGAIAVSTTWLHTATVPSFGLGFTEKQRHFAIKLVSKYKDVLSNDLSIDIERFILNPQFKLPIRELIVGKYISVVDNRIQVKFPYNEEISNSFKEYKKTLPYFLSQDIAWNPESRSWHFGLIEENILLLSALLDAGFSSDEEFSALSKEVATIAANYERYTPMVVYEGGKFSYKNVVPAIPQPISTDLIEVLLDARQYGITKWDDAIQIAVEHIDPAVSLFLKNTAETVVLDHEKYSLDNIIDIIKFNKSTMFVIPGGTELEHLRSIHQFLNKNGYSNDEITVMFRLDSSSGKICNDYIKENKLNSPLSDSIKFVLISGKIPKPLIESNKAIDVVVHFGLNSAHYTLKKYIKNHHNVINIGLITNRK